MGAMLKSLRAFVLLLAMPLICGCTTEMTLEEAQARCTQQGGLLVVIFTQKLVNQHLADPVAHPGDCISPDRFHKPGAAAPPASPPPPAP